MLRASAYNGLRGGGAAPRKSKGLRFDLGLMPGPGRADKKPQVYSMDIGTASALTLYNYQTSVKNAGQAASSTGSGASATTDRKSVV